MNFTIYGNNPLTGDEEKLMSGDFDTKTAALKQLAKELVRGFKRIGVVPTNPRPDSYKLVDETGEESWFAVAIAVDLNVMGREIAKPTADSESPASRRKRGLDPIRPARKSKAPPSLSDMLNEGKELPEALPDYSETFSDQDLDASAQDIAEYREEGETAFQEELNEEENRPDREPAERIEREEEDREENEELTEIRKEEENR